jgi:RES domain-containing protein
MRLWRLSSARRARAFDGGFGLLNPGRWNTAGRPVTYCATVPSLTALEKRVHIVDPAELPPQVLVAYEAPDDISWRAVQVSDLPTDWAAREILTQAQGDAWLDATSEALLVIPSVIMPLPDIPDRNVLINHRHPEAVRIRIADIVPFELDPRLFRP